MGCRDLRHAAMMSPIIPPIPPRISPSPQPRPFEFVMTAARTAKTTQKKSLLLNPPLFPPYPADDVCRRALP